MAKRKGVPLMVYVPAVLKAALQQRVRESHSSMRQEIQEILERDLALRPPKGAVLFWHFAREDDKASPPVHLG
jgi:hypothetical protein